MKHAVMLAFSLLFSWSAQAAIDTYHFQSEAQEQQFRELTGQLRCPKCQNNSIADSNSMISADMRLKVYELMEQGQSRQQIVDYMVARYGNFVTYEPPVTPFTVILWALPALFVLGGMLMIIWRAKRRPETQCEELDDSQHKRLNDLLNNKGQRHDTAD